MWLEQLWQRWSNYTWVINNYIALLSATYIRGSTVSFFVYIIHGFSQVIKFHYLLLKEAGGCTAGRVSNIDINVWWCVLKLSANIRYRQFRGVCIRCHNFMDIKTTRQQGISIIIQRCVPIFITEFGRSNWYVIDIKMLNDVNVILYYVSLQTLSTWGFFRHYGLTSKSISTIKTSP